MKRARRAGSRVASALFLAAYAVASIYPFAWLISGAFKTPREAVSSGSFIPTEWTLDGLVAAWSALNFQLYFLNSAIVTTSSIAIAFLLYPLAAFAFSVYEFPFKPSRLLPMWPMMI